MSEHQRPERPRRRCEMHDDFDTNGDGDCRTYSTASLEMRPHLEPCVLTREER